MKNTLKVGLLELGERAQSWVKKVKALVLLRVEILKQRSTKRDARPSKEVDRWVNEGGSTSTP